MDNKTEYKTFGEMNCRASAIPFLRAFRIINGIDSETDDDAIFLLLSRDSSLNNRYWRMFVITCKNLCQVGAIYPIVRFMCFVFSNTELFNDSALADFEKNLKNSLYDYCKSFYDKHHSNDKNKNWSHEDYAEYILEDNQESDIENRIKEYCEKAVKESENGRIPGMLMPLYYEAERVNNTKLCNYIIEKVFDSFKNVRWDLLKADNPSKPVLAQLAVLADYFEYYSMQFPKYLLKYRNNRYEDTEKRIYDEADDPEAFINGIDYCGLDSSAKKMAGIIRKIDRKYLEKLGKENLSRFFSYGAAPIISGINIKYKSELKKAIGFISDYYDYILPDDRRNYLLIYTLGYCILKCDDLSKANNLYGKFRYYVPNSEDAFVSDKGYFLDKLDKMLVYVDEWIDLIFNKDGQVFNKIGQAFYAKTEEEGIPITYSDEGLKRLKKAVEKAGVKDFIEEMRGLRNSKKIPDKTDFNRLVDIIDGYSKEGVIDFTLLGYKEAISDPEIKDDKIEVRWVKDLKDKGQLLLSEVGILKDYSIRMEKCPALEVIETEDCRHINDLWSEHLRKKIKETRKATKGKEDDERYAKLSEAYDEAVSLAPRFNLAVCRNYARFSCDRFKNKVDNSGWLEYTFSDTVSENETIRTTIDTIEKYIQTAEYVYQSLESLNKRGEVDYSPAVLPLTKALETIVNYIFNTIKETAPNSKELFEGVDKKKKFCFYSYEKNGHTIYKLKNSITLGTGAYFFSKQYLSNDEFKSFMNQCVDIKIKGRKETVEKIIEEAKIKLKNGQNIQNIFGFLSFVTNEYRNKLAHCNKFGKAKAEKARKLMLDSEMLIWCMLYILKTPEEPEKGGN